MNTYFGQTMSTGELQIPIGNATTSTIELATYVEQGQMIATIIKNGELPIEYEIGYNNTLSSAINSQQILNLVIIVGTVIAIMIIYLVFRYRTDGLLAGISWVGFIACLLLILRFTNCIFSMNTIIAITIISIWEYIFLNAVVHNKLGRNFKELMTHYIILSIPMYFVAIVFVFGTSVAINSFGMALFWGNVLMLAYNLLITQNIMQKQ